MSLIEKGVKMKSTRASDLGIRIGHYSHGKFNAITDVADVKSRRFKDLTPLLTPKNVMMALLHDS